MLMILIGNVSDSDDQLSQRHLHCGRQLLSPSINVFSASSPHHQLLGSFLITTPSTSLEHSGLAAYMHSTLSTQCNGPSRSCFLKIAELKRVFDVMSPVIFPQHFPHRFDTFCDISNFTTKSRPVDVVSCRQLLKMIVHQQMNES